MNKPIEDGEYKEKVENKLQNKIIKDYGDSIQYRLFNQLSFDQKNELYNDKELYDKWAEKCEELIVKEEEKDNESDDFDIDEVIEIDSANEIIVDNSDEINKDDDKKEENEEEEIEVDDDNDSCAISTGQKFVDVDFHPSKQIKEDNFLSHDVEWIRIEEIFKTPILTEATPLDSIK